MDDSPMQVADLPSNEQARLDALYELRLLDTPQEDRFDAIAQLAASIFNVPVAFVSFIDHHRQWFKAKVGFDLCETSRDYSFCSYAILQDQPLIIPDATRDQRFADNPFVKNEPFLRFYAGESLKAAGGERIGTLCIADVKPRSFSEADAEILRQLGALAERELKAGDLIDAQSEVLEVQSELLKTQTRLREELNAAAGYVLSQLPAPLQQPLDVDWRFIPSEDIGGDGLGYHFIDSNRFAFYLLDVCGHGVAPALMSISLLSILKSHSLLGVDFTDPASVLVALNRDFPMQRHGNRFFTICYGVIDLLEEKLVYSNAGHPPAVLVPDTGASQRLESIGIPIGCSPTASYENRACAFRKGDILYLFSDGAFEARGSARSFDVFEQFLARTRGDAGTSLDEIVKGLKPLNGSTHFSDDVTIMRLAYGQADSQ
jgi:sigma-B regulation protein RsbU (phosphoserine phosphatase)